jgi:homoserine O-acetyltransferase
MTKKNEIVYVETKYFVLPKGEDFLLQSGVKLPELKVAYETYGKLNEKKNNAVLICHALSGDAHAAGYHPGESKPGWWNDMIGPGRAFDTDKYYVVCSNIIGGCKGSSGPNSINPKTGRPYGLSFPIVSITDMVNAQKKLVDHLGVKKLLSVCGGSMGGMQALQWALSYPDFLISCIPIATTAKHSAQQMKVIIIPRRPILRPDWR